jgi:hypothetical protein
VAIEQDGVGERPEVFGGLQFGGIGEGTVGGHAPARAGGGWCASCRPERSTTSTTCLRGPAPTTSAKAASSMSTSRMETLVARWKSVRPEAGRTKPTRDSQAKRGWTTAVESDATRVRGRCAVRRWPTTRRWRAGGRSRPRHALADAEQQAQCKKSPPARERGCGACRLCLKRWSYSHPRCTATGRPSLAAIQPATAR